jgi:hypothetical protein
MAFVKSAQGIFQEFAQDMADEDMHLLDPGCVATRYGYGAASKVLDLPAFAYEAYGCYAHVTGSLEGPDDIP